jgi:hypothetical protein
MREKADMFLGTAIRSNGVFEEKSSVVVRCFSTNVLQLSRSLRYRSGDFEDFNFLDLEIRRTKVLRNTFRVCVVVIGKQNVTKEWTEVVTTNVCLPLLFGLQRKCPERDVVRILQCEKETLQTRVGLPQTRERLFIGAI